MAVNKPLIASIILSDKGANWIGNFEGFRAMPYRDGGGLWTIGFGHRISDPLAYPKGISVQTAITFMKLDVQKTINGLISLELDLPLQHHQDAVISLVYNIGIGAFGKSVIYEALKAKSGDLWAWESWIKDNKGVVEKGLVERRELERQCFIWGVYNNL